MKDHYYILEIPELNMVSGKTPIKEVIPELHFALGTHKLTFRCKKRTSAVIDATKKPPKPLGCIGWYKFESID